MRKGTNPAKGTQSEVDQSYHRIIIPVYIPNLEGFFEQSLSVLKLCLESLYTTVHDRTRISVASNGSCKEVNDFLSEELEARRIDELFIVKTGIGKINSIFKIMNSVKEPIVTVSDADVLFSTGWQSDVEQIFLDYRKVGMICPFSYSKGIRELTANMFFDNFFNKNIKIDKIDDPMPLEHFAESIGNPDFYNDVQKKYGVVYQKKNKSKVLIGAGHFVASFRRKIFDTYTFSEKLRKLAHGERKYLDTPAVEYGLWRVSTHKNYVYHMGNTIIPMYEDIVKQNQNSLPMESTFDSKATKQSTFWFNVKNKYFARIIYSKKVFRFLVRKYGLTKEEAEQFLK